MERRVIILGGAGDGSVMAEAMMQARAAGGGDTLVGFLNDAMSPGEKIYGVPVLGKLEKWKELGDDVHFAWALQRFINGSTSNSNPSSPAKNLRSSGYLKDLRFFRRRFDG